MGTLYLVATPIGNLEDVTLRALRVLAEADLLLAEDTRRSRVLLTHHGIAARPRSLHAHNEAARLGEALSVLESGSDGKEGSVALVSDAGTPLVSDPGERLVAAAVEAGHEVVALPGASAVTTALVASGLSATPFSFVGFPPRRNGERRQWLEALAPRRETLVLFESPRRVGETLAELAEVLGDRPAALARELTKLHEEIARGRLSELARRFADGARGECTLVVAGAPEPEPPSPHALDDEIRRRITEGASPREIAAELVRGSGRPKREIYARALALRNGEVPALDEDVDGADGEELADELADEDEDEV